MMKLNNILLVVCLLAALLSNAAGQEAAQDLAAGDLAATTGEDESSGCAYDYDTAVYPEVADANVTDAEWETWPDSNEPSEPQDASLLMTTTAFEKVGTSPNTEVNSVSASEPATAPASGVIPQGSTTGSGSAQGSAATTAAADSGPQWHIASMSAPTVLPEDQPGAGADADLIKPTDKVDGSNPTSTGTGNPPGTIMTMTGAATTSSGAAAASATSSGGSGQATAGVISTPLNSGSLDSSSAVLNLAGSSLVAGADELVPKPNSDTSSSTVCGPISTYLLLASLFLSIAYIL